MFGRLADFEKIRTIFNGHTNWFFLKSVKCPVSLKNAPSVQNLFSCLRGLVFHRDQLAVCYIFNLMCFFLMIV